MFADLLFGHSTAFDWVRESTPADNLRLLTFLFIQQYGVAHAGILGTSRPTRFIVMTDEARLTPDDLQSATNSLCHAYARCNRAVSLPAPVYYADAICTRVRSWMPTDDGHGSVGGATASSGSGDAQSRAIDFSSYEHALAWVATGLDSFRGAPGRLPTMWWL